MSQYLIAVWDYTAEGEFELSFRQGDRIKLLEKHNDDWWEGELNEEIGFFPANRVKLESKAATPPPEQDEIAHHHISTNNHTIKDDHYINNTAVENFHALTIQDIPPTIPRRPSKEEINHMMEQATTIEQEQQISIATNPPPMTESPLPEGWEHAYDQEGTIYYFNESTGESRWDKPTTTEADQPPPLPLRRDESNSTSDYFIPSSLSPDQLAKLEFDQLQPDWIRHKGLVQMKMISTAATEESNNKKQDKLSSWKVYYAVLSNGFLLLYKEGHVKSKKSSRSHIPVGSFDLESCKIDPAGKTDTKRKHVFIISTTKKVNLYIQTTSDKEFSNWLDAIMRELVARKEGQNEDTEIMRLLKSLTFDESHMKVNRKMTKEEEINQINKKKGSVGNWFKQPSKSGSSDIQKIEPKYVYGQTQSSDENDIFGGYLRMEENGDIPHIVSMCIKEVEARGLKSVGIYRLSGPASTIQKYRTSVNNKEAISFKDEHDINTVTGLLKLYFRELRNPLMTHEYYEWFIEAARISDYEERMYQIKSIIHSLPRPNFTVLEYLMRHLSLVASYSEINKMEASNLALIFSVGLLRSSQEDLGSILMSDLSSKIVESIIQQVDWFFEEDIGEEEEGEALVQVDE